VHRLQVDVVGVEKEGLAPAHILHCHVRRVARLHRLGADNGVLAVRLVPHRNDFHARVGGQKTCGKLGLRLVAKRSPTPMENFGSSSVSITTLFITSPCFKLYRPRFEPILRRSQAYCAASRRGKRAW